MILFLQEFARLLEAQISTGERLGHSLASADLNLLNNQQIGQLYELQKETSKAPPS